MIINCKFIALQRLRIKGFHLEDRHLDITDHELLYAIKKGDAQAFDTLFNRYNLMLYKHAHQMLKDSDACNDIIQEVFMSIWVKRKKLEININVLAYLYKVTRNKVLDYISHDKVIHRYRDTIIDFERKGKCYTEESILEKELLTLLEEKKANLSARTRMIFEMNRERHLSYKEIGEKLSISPKTAKKQVHNALKYLREQLAPILILLFLSFL